ncbi:MAG TPA: kelch repeat-containing protein [Gemmatimonadales bacterium]
MSASSDAPPVVCSAAGIAFRETAVKTLLILAFAGPVATLAACGGDSSTDSSEPVATVTVTPNPASVPVGAMVQLTAALENAAGNPIDGRPITWASGATGVATVDGDGTVTGIAVGTADVTATSEGVSGDAVVTVTASSDAPPIGPGESAILFTGFDKATENHLYSLALLGRSLLDILITDMEGHGAPKAQGFPASGGAQSILRRGTASARAATPITSSVLFTGGYESATGIPATRHAALYDPATDEGVNLEMTEARYYHTISPLPGSRALIVGGFDGNTVRRSAEIFTESTRSFAATGDMAEARGRHAAAPLPDGRVLVTGGLVPVGGGPATIDVRSTELFDPSTGAFAAGPDMTVTRFNHSAIALDDGRVLVLGGNGRNSAEVYDPVANEFTAVGNMEVNHGLGHQAVKLLDGRVLVVGGDGGTIQPTAVVEVFDPDTDQFTRTGDMTSTRMLHFAVLDEATGQVLVGGGQDASGELLASTEIYDPTEGTFTAFLDLSVESSEQAGVFIQR